MHQCSILNFLCGQPHFYDEQKYIRTTSGLKEVFGMKRRKFGKIASRAIFLLSLVRRPERNEMELERNVSFV